MLKEVKNKKWQILQFSKRTLCLQSLGISLHSTTDCKTHKSLINHSKFKLKAQGMKKSQPTKSHFALNGDLVRLQTQCNLVNLYTRPKPVLNQTSDKTTTYRKAKKATSSTQFANTTTKSLKTSTGRRSTKSTSSSSTKTKKTAKRRKSKKKPSKTQSA